MKIMNNQCYAILPAAGRSRRMGESKLLLPWPTKERPNGRVIDQVLGIWGASLVSQVIVVVRQDDQKLADACAEWPVDIVRPKVDPEDMLDSIRAGVQFLNQLVHPRSNDIIAICPSDIPTLSSDLINNLCLLCGSSSKICVPCSENGRGHPIALPWQLSGKLHDIPVGQGMNALFDLQEFIEYQVTADMIAKDIDTPADYITARRMRGY